MSLSDLVPDGHAHTTFYFVMACVWLLWFACARHYSMLTLYGSLFVKARFGHIDLCMMIFSSAIEDIFIFQECSLST